MCKFFLIVIIIFFINPFATRHILDRVGEGSKTQSQLPFTMLFIHSMKLFLGLLIHIFSKNINTTVKKHENVFNLAGSHKTATIFFLRQ